MRIGILKTGQSPEVIRGALGDYDQMFERLLGGRGFDFDSYHVEAMQFPPDVHAADGWLITGSRPGAYQDHPFIPPLEDFIRAAYAAGVPVVGICFGHQIIAQALGGRVEKHKGGWAVGAQDYDFAGQTVTLNAWHQDQVVTAPEGAEVVTVEMKINLLAPGVGARLVAEGRVVKAGRRIVVVAADVWAEGPAGRKQVATMLGTMVPVEA